MTFTFHIPAALYIFATTYLTTRTFATALNLFFWFKSPDDWAAFVERAPKLSMLVRLSRAWGIDWRKVLRLIRSTTAALRKQGLQLPEAVDTVTTTVIVATTSTTTTTPSVPAATLPVESAMPVEPATQLTASTTSLVAPPSTVVV